MHFKRMMITISDRPSMILTTI